MALQDLVDWLALGRVDRVAIWMLFLAWAASVVQVHWAAWQARSSGVRPVSGESGTGELIACCTPTRLRCESLRHLLGR